MHAHLSAIWYYFIHDLPEPIKIALSIIKLYMNEWFLKKKNIKIIDWRWSIHFSIGSPRNKHTHVKENTIRAPPPPPLNHHLITGELFINFVYLYFIGLIDFLSFFFLLRKCVVGFFFCVHTSRWKYLYFFISVQNVLNRERIVKILNQQTYCVRTLRY